MRERSLLVAIVSLCLISPGFADHTGNEATWHAPSGPMQTGLERSEDQIHDEFNSRMAALRDHPNGSLEGGANDYGELMEGIQHIQPPDKQVAFMRQVLQMQDEFTNAMQMFATDPRAAQELFNKVRAERQSMLAGNPALGGPLRDVTELFHGADMKAVLGDNWKPEALAGLRAGAGMGPGMGGGNPPQSGDWASDLRRDFPHSLPIAIGVGDALRSGGDFKGAADSYRAATQIDPANKKAWNNLAETQLQYGDMTGAVESGRRALEIDPRDPVATSIVRMYGGRASASTPPPTPPPAAQTPAFRDFAAPATPSPRYTGPTPEQSASVDSQRLAERLLGVRDVAGALKAAQKAVQADPTNARALWTLYQVHRQMKDYQSALHDLDQAIAVSPRSPLLLNAKADTLNRLNRFPEALELADALISQNPSDAAAYMSKSFALSGLGQRDAAIAALKEAVRLRPDQKPLLDAALALPKDVDLVRLFNGSLSPEELQRLTMANGGKRRFPWGQLAGGAAIAAALFLAFLLSRPGSEGWATGLKRSLARMGSASPTVQPMAPSTPVDGLAASGIRVERKIGAGGMGIVYAGTDTSLDRRVAIKKMREEIRSDVRERERFLREAKTVASLKHPNIVEIYSIVEDGSDVYLVFEFVTGKTVHELTYENGRLPLHYAAAVVKAVASALDYAHRRGVIHRDLKPANIMVEEEGMVKVMDFGVARQAQDSLARMAMTNTVVGTPPYMAPEQEQGIVRKESDVYALAVCLYEMLTGQLPFQGVGAGMLMAKLNGTYVPASRVVEGLPAGFDAVMAGALQPDADKRYRSAGEFAQALSALPVA